MIHKSVLVPGLNMPKPPFPHRRLPRHLCRPRCFCLKVWTISNLFFPKPSFRWNIFPASLPPQTRCEGGQCLAGISLFRLEWTRRGSHEYEVEQDPEANARMISLSGGRRSVPLLVEEGKVIQVGWQGRSCIVDAGRCK